ncbi:MAG: cation:proton antiporter [Deltaproteobacteria bacterium]|nr:cation:proton antiporter [Deltaproteobacteria bacterium]
MNQIPLLQELAIIAGLGAAVTVLLGRLRLPAVAGLLATGALAGPFGLGLVNEVHAIEALAEIGVVLLLFTIGLEFSLKRLRHIFRRVALGGLVQVGSTVAVATWIALALGEPPGRAVFYGFVFALSSTAIVLRVLSQRGEIDAPHGRFIVGTLIFQDLCVIPMMLIVPVLGSQEPAGAVISNIGFALGKAVIVVVGILLVARVLVSRVLRWVDARRSREVFILAVLAICIGTAWLTSLTGLPLALGAFLGGIVVADSEFKHRAMGDMIPLRNAFVSVFFVSLGMMFDGRILLSHPLEVALLLGGFVLGKGTLATLAAAAMRFPTRAMWLAGVGLAQFGEFGFVIIQLAHSSGLADRNATGALLAAGIISMFLTPVIIRIAPHITAGERLLAPLTRLLGVRGIDQESLSEPIEGHVVVIGYGIAGKLVTRALATCGIPQLVLELNADTVRVARAANEPVYYADATSPEALGHARVTAARSVVILINDPEAAVRVVDTVHRVAPKVPVFIRTRYLADRTKLIDLGAADVVAEEVEASVEVIARILRHLEVPRNLIDTQIHEARKDTQASERVVAVPRSALPEHKALADLKIESLAVTKHSYAAGRTSLDLGVRQKTQALIVALRRDGILIDHLDPKDPFQIDDVIYLVGSIGAIREAIALLEGNSR